MLKKNKILIIMIIVMVVFLVSCSSNQNDHDEANQSNYTSISNNENLVSISEEEEIDIEVEYSGKIFLYGEKHGVDIIIEKEFDLWYGYYHENGMRHLFIESPYYTAEFLNLWMKTDNNKILDELFIDWTGTMQHNLKYMEFYEKIKKECPETIFHGTDVGHQYESTGQRYLEYLRNNNLLDSDKYLIAKENVKQGEQFSNSNSSVYRENMMVENFKRELETLNDENIMGIFGSAHTDLDGMDISNTVPGMANQLKELYGDHVYSEDLSSLAIKTEPDRVDMIEVMGKTYEASYFGKYNMDFTNEYQYREFWRLENAYDDFENCILAMTVLPESNYPIPIEEKQVFVVDYTKSNGSVSRVYYRVDGFIWKGMLTSEEFSLQKLPSLEKPKRIDEITVAGKSYDASYFGKHEFGGLFGTDNIEYWRLENAYVDFKDIPIDDLALPHNMYPMPIEIGEVFVLDITLADGSTLRAYMRSDGNEWRGQLSTEGFTIEN